MKTRIFSGNTFSNRLLLTCFAGVLVLAAFSSNLHAGVEVRGQPTKPVVRPNTSVNVDEAAKGLEKIEAPRLRTLRCWQNGQLIVERRIERIPEDATRIVRIGDSLDPEAQVFDLRSSTCVLQ